MRCEKDGVDKGWMRVLMVYRDGDLEVISTLLALLFVVDLEIRIKVLLEFYYRSRTIY